DGVRKPSGVYGSTTSAAPVENQDDTKFSGFGTVTTLGVALDTGEPRIVSVIKTATEVTLTWTSNPGETYSIFSSLDLEDFDDELDDGVPAAADASVTELTIPVSVLGDDVEKAFFKVIRN
ncbi:hypothetical protein N8522_05660, partial [Akkermansiaceae bacterium]|nr:hypothetical protein [Akkermansiaceae bacterium]